MNVSRMIVRQIATSNVAKAGEIPKGYFKLREIQQKFQQNDGKPVFLKGGAIDQILYRLTMGLAVVGLGAVGALFWDLSVPKKE